jgi:hypothetical protein
MFRPFSRISAKAAMSAPSNSIQPHVVVFSATMQLGGLYWEIYADQTTSEKF